MLAVLPPYTKGADEPLLIDDWEEVEEDNACWYPEEAEDTDEVGSPVAYTDGAVTGTIEEDRRGTDTEGDARTEPVGIELAPKLV